MSRVFIWELDLNLWRSKIVANQEESCFEFVGTGSVEEGVYNIHIGVCHPHICCRIFTLDYISVGKYLFAHQ